MKFTPRFRLKQYHFVVIDIVESANPDTMIPPQASLIFTIVVQLRGATTRLFSITDTNPGEGGSQQNDAVLRVLTQHTILVSSDA
jgi:hypothetical protein